MTEPEIVLARVYKSAHDRMCSGGLAMLVWPMEPATYTPGGSVTCWERIGQHGGCDLFHMREKTRPATAEEAAAAIAQWRSEGPERSEAEYPLTVKRRAPSWSRVMTAHRAYLKQFGG